MRSVWSALAVMGVLHGCAGSKGTEPADTEVVIDETEVETDAGGDSEQEVDADVLPPLLDPCLEGELAFELGMGMSRFTPTAPGSSVAVEVGATGPRSYHLWGAVRARNVPRWLSLDLTLTDVPTGVLVFDYRFNAALIPAGSAASWACDGHYTGLHAVLQDWEAVRDAAGLPATTPFEQVFCGTDLRMDVVVSFLDHELTRSSLTIKVQPDPLSGAPCEAPIR